LPFLVSESEAPNTKIIAKIQFKKRKNREKSEIEEYKKSKRKAIRKKKFSDDSQKIKIIIRNYLDSVYKIYRNFKKEIFSLKRKIEKVRINKKNSFLKIIIYSQLA
jgi:hypothetical protein